MDNIPHSLFQLLVFLIVLLPSVIIHEIAHGLVALRLGDPTAKLAGRLTLNPIKHLEFVGSFLVPLLLSLTSPIVLGWAKPVPYNPMMLSKDYKYGPLKVALAGPASNLFIAVLLSLIIRLGSPFIGPAATGFLTLIVFLNVLLAVFNLIPIPPLDGSKILMTFLPREQAQALEQVGLIGIFLIFLILYFSFGFITNASLFITNLLIGHLGFSVY